jgi:hypothetical protein
VFTARYVLPTQCIYVCCVDLRTNSDYFTIQHYLNGFYKRDGVCLLRGTLCSHSVFMCFVWIWEQTAIISLYSINWLVFITETECLLRGTFCPHSVFKCLVWIPEQTAIISLYSITRLVFITLGTFQKQCSFGNRGQLEKCFNFTFERFKTSHVQHKNPSIPPWLHPKNHSST